jgi:predicted TPR repeat methyltransferase
MNRKQRRSGQPSSPTALDPIALHAAGVQACSAGQLELAANLIAQAIAANGTMPAFHYNLAIVLKAQGKLKAAAASYSRAIALKPDYADAHNNLGNIWKELGQLEKARMSFERALRLIPENANAHYNLGVLCSEAGQRDQAARHFDQCLAQDPDDSRGARILLAHLGLVEAPERTSSAQLQKIYSVRSQFWDRERSYFGHVLVADALKSHAGRADRDILDIGCGTGLVGVLVRPLARRLDGVDVSPAMLEKARAKTLYDGLFQTDLVSFMTDRQGCYDAVLAAAALIHFGELRALFRGSAQCLRDKGLFIFTFFPNETHGQDFAVAASDRLAQSGCFRHSTGYVERLARANGFSIQMLKPVLHERDQDGNAVAGILAVLQRA